MDISFENFCLSDYKKLPFLQKKESDSDTEYSLNVLGKTRFVFCIYIFQTEGLEENVLNGSEASHFALAVFSLIPPAAYL